jgi:hypothetical protein
MIISKEMNQKCKTDPEFSETWGLKRVWKKEENWLSMILSVSPMIDNIPTKLVRKNRKL